MDSSHVQSRLDHVETLDLCAPIAFVHFNFMHMIVLLKPTPCQPVAKAESERERERDPLSTGSCTGTWNLGYYKLFESRFVSHFALRMLCGNPVVDSLEQCKSATIRALTCLAQP